MEEQLVYTIHSPDEMRKFGQLLGEKINKNILLLLIGDLGAGKTLLTQAIASGLGVKEDVTSPTFAIMNTYESGRLPLHHFDLYRIEDVSELEPIGFYEYVKRGVSIVEWADKFIDEMPKKHISIHIEKIDERTRQVKISSTYYSEDQLVEWGGNICI